MRPIACGAVNSKPPERTWKPVLCPSNWLRMKLLPWRALPQTATTPIGSLALRSILTASWPTVNLPVSVSYLQADISAFSEGSCGRSA